MLWSWHVLMSFRSVLSPGISTNRKGASLAQGTTDFILHDQKYKDITWLGGTVLC